MTICYSSGFQFLSVRLAKTTRKWIQVITRNVTENILEWTEKSRFDNLKLI